MYIEKSNQKMLVTGAIILLAAILILIAAGIFMQDQTLSSRERDTSRITNPFFQSESVHESVQTSPTGKLVLSAGIVLLLIAFGVIVTMLWVGRNKLRRNST